MTDHLSISFAGLDSSQVATLVLLVQSDLDLSEHAADIDKKSDGQLLRAAKAAAFTGKAKSSIEILAPSGLKADRVILVGVGDVETKSATDWCHLGGSIYATIASRKTKTACLVAQTTDEGEVDSAQWAALLAQGALLRAYQFSKYRTDKAPAQSGHGAAGGKTNQLNKLVIQTSDPKTAEKAFKRLKAVAKGVIMARDLVNEPANSLGPVEFAAQAKALTKLGVEVEILDDKDLKRLKMGALLAVGQGSERPTRVAVMHWNSSKAKQSKPICFVGKGVVFDTGGISMKPPGGMEDMKGDMGGAACVLGLMQALAGRKAPVNAIGIIGLVENMPSGKAIRPGDIVTSMSGQTIEVINTDAEGRLVLADLLHFAQKKYKPKMIIDLATLTGAILVALGKDHAGLFSNNDDLAIALAQAGATTGEKVWRMPLGPAYDKLINTRNADMKNIGGRLAGSITAAQFLQRFITDEEVAWAHLDVAGTAMASPNTDINRSWGSGWGVRLLDQLVTDHYE